MGYCAYHLQCHKCLQKSIIELCLKVSLFCLGCLTGFSEEGSRGILCLLKRRVEELRGQKKTVLNSYRAILQSETIPWLGDEEEKETEEERDWQRDSSSDSEDDDE